MIYFTGVSMNNKKNGIRIGTIMWVIASFVAAVIFWIIAKYSEASSQVAMNILYHLVKL